MRHCKIFEVDWWIGKILRNGSTEDFEKLVGRHVKRFERPDRFCGGRIGRIFKNPIQNE